MSRQEQVGYEIAANWMRDPTTNRPGRGRGLGTFTEQDGINLPTEDFANNVEYLLFDPAKLKALTPSLFGWFRSYLGDTFKVGGECASKAAVRK